MLSPLPADTRPPPASSFGRIRINSITTRLVLFMIGAFVVDRALFRFGVHYADSPAPGVQISPCPPIIGLAQFSVGATMLHGNREFWRLVTWPFVHISMMHLLVNAAGLHFFGPILEAHYGSRRFLIFYLLCAAGGLLAYFVLWWTRYLITNDLVPMFGASAPVLGLLVAAAHIAPEAKATIYDLVPVKLRTLALALLGLTLYATFTYGRAAFSSTGDGAVAVTAIGGAAAHLGGAVVGLALIRSPQWVRIFDWRPFGRPPPF